jgi:hypothetical protein
VVFGPVGVYENGVARVLADADYDATATRTVTLDVGSVVPISARGSYFLSTKRASAINRWTLYGALAAPGPGTVWTVLDDRTDRDYGLSTDGHWHEVPYSAVHAADLKFRFFKLELGLLGAPASVRLAVRHAH